MAIFTDPLLPDSQQATDAPAKTGNFLTALMRRLRTLLQTYRKAGGGNAIVLFHDGEHGDALIDALARFGAGLPAHVLPLRVNEVTQLGPENLAAVFAYGGSGVALLTRAKPKHDIAGLRRAVRRS